MERSTSESADLKMSAPDVSVLSMTLYEAMNSDKPSSMCDATLVSSDGERIPTIRIVLAMSSPYFQKLLFSEFAEKKLSEIPISITSGLLKEVIQFICTDDSHSLQVVRGKMQNSSIIDCANVEALIELADVADYLQNERLLSRCEEAVKCIIQSKCAESPHLACMTLRALGNGRSSWGKELYSKALKHAQGNVNASLFGECGGCKLKFGVLHLDKQAAEDVFAVVTQNKDEQGRFFQALIIWACGGELSLLAQNDNDEDDDTIKINTSGIKIIDDLKEPAVRMASWFDIKRFKPEFLLKVVERSGLVEYDTINAAYKKHSIRLERRVRSLKKQLNLLKSIRARK